MSTPATANSVAGALGNGFLFASLGAGFAFASVAWTWRLTRLARLEPASAATPDLAYVLRKTRGALRFGRGSTRVIQRRFNVSVPRARVLETAPTLRERSEG